MASERRGREPAAWRADRQAAPAAPAAGGPADRGRRRGRRRGQGGPGGGGTGGWGRGRPSTVFVLGEAGRPKPIDVRVGISDGQFVEVREGLEEGAQVDHGHRDPRRAAPAQGPRPGSLALEQPLQSAVPAPPALRPKVAEPLIRVVDLRRSYALGDVTVHALRGVTLDIDKGSMRGDRGRLGLAASRRS